MSRCDWGGRYAPPNNKSYVIEYLENEMSRNVARGLLLITVVAAGASSLVNAQEPYRVSEARASGEYSFAYDSPNYRPHFVSDRNGTGRESCLIAVGVVLRKAQAPATVGITVVPHTRTVQDLNVAPVTVSR